MKKALIIILVIICSVSLPAQEKYSFSAKIGSGIAMTTPDITPFNIDAMIHYNLTSCLAFGGGTGLGLYDNISVIPLYANIKYMINPKAKFNMFADSSIGYGFTLGSEKNGGFYLNPEFGVQRKLWNKTFLIAVGYQWQNLERRKSNSDNYVSSQFVEELSLQSISLKLGIVF